MQRYRIAFSLLVDAEGVDEGDAINRARMALDWHGPPKQRTRRVGDLTLQATIRSVMPIMTRPLVEGER